MRNKYRAHNAWLLIEPTRSQSVDRVSSFTATVAVTSRDGRRKPIQDARITFQAIPHVTFSAPNCVTNDSGTGSVTFTSTTPSRVLIKAIIHETGVRLSRTPVVFSVFP